VKITSKIGYTTRRDMTVWFRQWVQWEEYDDSVPDWLARQVAGSLVIPGLPLRIHGGFVPMD
jgi:hypothetical protein